MRNFNGGLWGFFGVILLLLAAAVRFLLPVRSKAIVTIQEQNVIHHLGERGEAFSIKKVGEAIASRD